MDSVLKNATSEQHFYGFDWSDYTVFVLMLFASVLIGIYFGCFGSKQRSPIDYLLGGKSMNYIPVAFSIVASFISGSTLIGVPSEVYTENPSTWLNQISLAFSSIVSYYVFIPSFYELKVDSAFEYLELRFNKNIRTIASWYYCLAYLIYLPTVIYGPSLTLSLVTGVNLHVISASVTLVCIFYTMLGGLKAVVWTDCFQMLVTLLACIAIIVIGTIDAGGFVHVMKTAYDDDKLTLFNMDPSPFIRNTFWTNFVGGFVSNVAFISVSQASIQRFISLRSSKDLPKVLVILNIGAFLITTMCIYGGILLYTVYYGCDPIKNNKISKADEIFPYYIIDKIDVPALPGLFVSGVFSAALSSLSTGFNTMTGIIYDDYVKSRINEKRAHIVMKIITVLIGVFAICTVFLIEKMGKIISASYIITSITFVPTFVMFTLGMLVPNCNTKGAMGGIISSTLFLGWIGFGSLTSDFNVILPEIYPEGINTCSVMNQTIIENTMNSSLDNIFIMYKLSYMLYTLFGLVVGVVFGIITSYLTGSLDTATLDPKLISPILRRFLPKKIENNNSIVLEKLMTPIK